jgi:uncharacterized protein
MFDPASHRRRRANGGAAANVGLTVSSSASLLGVLILALSATTEAASFDCAKASSLVEKAVCADAELSRLDDTMAKSYQQAMADTPNAAALRAQQRSWLKEVRNACRDVACLTTAYAERIAALRGSNQGSADTHRHVVLGRCHMDACWWWRIEGLEPVGTDRKGRLVKVAVRTTSEEYSAQSLQHSGGYPDMPARHAKWSEAEDVYLLCSTKRPTVISYDDARRRFSAIVPFGNDGVPWGYTQGIASLYDVVCNGNRPAAYDIAPGLEGEEVLLDRPADILRLAQ